MLKRTARVYLNAMKAARNAANALDDECEKLETRHEEAGAEDLTDDLGSMCRELRNLAQEMEHHEEDAKAALGIKED